MLRKYGFRYHDYQRRCVYILAFTIFSSSHSIATRFFLSLTILMKEEKKRKSNAGAGVRLAESHAVSEVNQIDLIGYRFVP